MALRQGRPLRLLCLDGGGVKGLTSLLILERIFQIIKVESGVSLMPKPHEYFDLIGGTSTGGLIAIMLGRLHMSVEECLSLYKRLCQKVFAPSGRTGFGMKYLNAGAGRAWFKALDLEEAVKKLLVERGLSEDTLLRETRDPACKVFVSVTRAQNSQYELLRTYQTQDPSQRNYECFLWEAARATTAAPMFFDKITLNNSGAEFVDGAMRLNNPVYEVVREAERISQPLSIGCILSLGTGWSNPISLEDPKLHNLVRACGKIAVDAQQKAEEFLHDSRGTELWKAQKYFRFNVEQGIQDVKLNEWKESEKMDAMTTSYLSRKDKAEELQACARNLLNPSPLISRYRKISIMPREPNLNFTGRTNYLHAIEERFQKSAPLYQRLVLWGLGGVGKSQIALKYAEQHQSRFAVFWIKADSKATIINGFGRIAQKLKPNYTSPDKSLELLSMVRGLLEDDLCEPWLMVLDGADDKDIFTEQLDSLPALADFIPRATQGRILITSRDSRIAGLADGQVAPIHSGIKIDPMSEEEGVELLEQYIPLNLFHNESSASGTEQRKRLVDLLGGLPLALSQAAAFIRYDQVPFNRFFEIYQNAKDHSDIFRYPAYSLEKEQQSVLLTWEISYERIGGQRSFDKKSAPAKLLDLMGFFHSQAIPSSSLEKIYKNDISGEEPFFSAMGRLLNFCLVYQNSRSEEYWIHPVVHEWIYRRLDAAERCKGVLVVVGELYDTFSRVEIAQSASSLRNICDGILPHVTTAIGFAIDNRVLDFPVSELSFAAGSIAQILGTFDLAVRLLRASVFVSQIIDSQTQLLDRRLRLAQCLLDSADAVSALTEVTACLGAAGEDNLENVKHWIGESLRLQGRSAEANAVQQELLALRIRQYGEISQPVALTKHNMAYNILRTFDAAMEPSTFINKSVEDIIGASQYAYVMKLCEESITTYEALGLTYSMNYLIFKYQHGQLQRDVSIKRTALLEVMEASIRLFGYEHDDTVQFGLAWMAVLSCTAQYTEMEKFGQNFLAHEPKQAQGKKAIKWGIVHNMVGISLQRQGRPAESEIYHRQALERLEKYADLSILASSKVMDVVAYNLTLCLARQQKDIEAAEVRDTHRRSVERAEMVHGTIFCRLQQDEGAKEILARAANVPQESSVNIKSSRTRNLLLRFRR